MFYDQYLHEDVINQNNKLQVLFLFTFKRIAKKMLLARIKANYSSGDDISSDEEEESKSKCDQELREDIEDGGTQESGK